MPAEAGIQRACNCLEKLDSRFHGNDIRWGFQTFYEFVKFKII